MQIQDLRPGDILIFKAHNDSKLSKIISILTNSDVSHSAIVDKDINYLLESSLEGGARTAIQSYSPRLAYIRRFETCPDPSLAVSVAASYVEAGFPYSYTELVASGIYILFSKIAPFLEHGKLLTVILEAASYVLVKAIDEKKNGGKEAFICSELVFRSYAETAVKYGSEYEIKLKRDSETYQTVLDMLLDYVSGQDQPVKVDANNAIPEFGCFEEARDRVESFYSEIKDTALKAQESNLTDLKSLDSNTLANSLDSKLLSTIASFCRLVLEWKGIELDDKEDLKKILTAMLKVKAMFVSPADLCYATTNLVDLQTLDY